MLGGITRRTRQNKKHSHASFISLALIIMMHSQLSSSSSSHEDQASGGYDFEGQILLQKGKWISKEDAILANHVSKHGEGKWNAVQKNSGLARSGKSCRQRWTNYLRPDLKKGPFTLEEEHKIIHLHAMLGNKWSLMAAELPGRTDNDIKNFWNTRTKKMELAGIKLYPDGKRPWVSDANQESSYVSSSEHVDISQANNPYIPDLKLTSNKLTQEYSSYAPSIFGTTESNIFEQDSVLSRFPVVCPLNMQYSSLDSTCISTAAAALLDQYTVLSGNTSVYETMLAELPSITYIETQQGSSWGTPACSLPQHPPFNESFDTLVQCAPPPEQTPSEPLSPRSNGFLEAIFYKPKVSEGSNNDSLLNG